MDQLAKADRQALTYGVAGTVALTIGGAFWALPHIEDELDEESAAIASYTEADGYVVEWNGRDGYLTVPAGTSQGEAEAVAADLADIRGTRDVEIVFASAPVGTEPDQDDQPAAPATTPAAFELDWSAGDRSGSGVVPTALADRLNSAFVTDEWTSGDDRTLAADTADTLTGVVAPLVGTDIESGRLSVADDEITVSGVVADAATQERLEALLVSQPSVTSVDLTVADAPATPATFAVTWDAASAQQSGTAPTELEATVASMGIDAPIIDDGLVVDETVPSTLDALAPLMGNSLTSGRAEVIDGRLNITATAPSDAERDAALTALGDADVTVEVDSSAADAGGAMDEVVLKGLEFETNTNVPTAETEAVIDEIAAVLSSFPDIEIEIVGHTDSRGDADANQALSESRAKAVLDGLIARGIDATRLSASGEGASEPVDSNETLEGQQNNRRVEIEIKENN